jgi:DNA-binding response OmpR family regulator
MQPRITPTANGMGSFRAVEGEGDVYDDGCLRVEHDNYYAVCKGRRMTFTRIEFLLLSCLTRNPERVVESEELWRHAWGGGKPYNSRSLHVHMYRLRGKFEPFGVRIENMAHVGYRISLAECCK